MSLTTMERQSLCIEATAGSGKTTLMIQHLHQLLVRHGVPADHCLAITFTDKAAKEMTHRLLEVLRKDPTVSHPLHVTSRLQIGTIHSFCQTILKKHALLIHQSSTYRILNDLEKKDRLHHILTHMKSQAANDPPQWLVDCLSTWSMDQFNQLLFKAYTNRESLTHWLSNGFYDLGDSVSQKNPTFQAHYDRMCHAFGTACDTFFSAITADKIADDWLDYDDILYKTYQLLSNVDWLRHQYQSQFQHIFVDEFQDTSPIQWQIVSLLCGDTDPYASKKLWVVGDRCQAIYSFRGADDQLMQMVLDTNHPALTHKKNTANYRSHPIIIDFINALFQRLFKDQGDSFLPMIPKKDTPESASISCYFHYNIDHDLQLISDNFQHHQYMGITLCEMAILVRKNMDAKRIQSFLDEHHIACQQSKGAGLCELDVIQVVICFLIGLLDHDDNVAWLSIAQDILRVDPSMIESLDPDSDGIYAHLKSHPMVVAWSRALHNGHKLDELCQLVWQLPIPMSANDQAAVHAFLSAFKTQWQHANQSHAMAWLHLCISHPKAMGTEQATKTDAVHIMTLHAAKGLEFSLVVVPFIDSAFNFGASDPLILSRHVGMGLSIPHERKNNHIRSAIYSNEKSRSILEEIRLFYVTLTRAKFHLCLTGQRLTRKNTSRLSLCLPYLLDNGDDCTFDFPYTPTIHGQSHRPKAMSHPILNNHLHVKSPVISEPIQTWSISNVLDAMSCPKQMMLKQLRPFNPKAHANKRMANPSMTPLHKHC